MSPVCNNVSAVQVSCLHISERETGDGTDPSRREERGDSSPRGPDPLRDRALRTELDGYIPREVFPLKRFIVAQERHDQSRDLPRLHER